MKNADTYICPLCHKHVIIGDEYKGLRITCPYCGSTWVVQKEYLDVQVKILRTFFDTLTAFED
jgi:DNA-directed RNA polymerase subunit RPC12/RpoP